MSSAGLNSWRMLIGLFNRSLFCRWDRFVRIKSWNSLKAAFPFLQWIFISLFNIFFLLLFNIFLPWNSLPFLKSARLIPFLLLGISPTILDNYLASIITGSVAILIFGLSGANSHRLYFNCLLILCLESTPPTELSVLHAQSLNLHCQCFHLVLEFEDIYLRLRRLKKMSRRRRIYERCDFFHWLFHCLRQSFSEYLHSIVDHFGMRDFNWLYWGLRPSKRVSPRANFADTKPALYLLIIDLKSRSILHLHFRYYLSR